MAVAAKSSSGEDVWHTGKSCPSQRSHAWYPLTVGPVVELARGPSRLRDRTTGDEMPREDLAQVGAGMVAGVQMVWAGVDI